MAPGAKATLLPDGTAAAPAEAPPEIQAAIFAADKLLDKPYKYGGGHAKVEDSGYDCSGTVSYALLGAGLLKSPLDSPSSFMRWGQKGKGTWFTVYTNPGHAFAMIAGLRLDTSAYGVSAKTTRKIARVGERGPRWRVSGTAPEEGLQGPPPARVLGSHRPGECGPPDSRWRRGSSSRSASRLRRRVCASRSRRCSSGAVEPRAAAPRSACRRRPAPPS